MANQSVKQRTNGLPDAPSRQELYNLLAAVQADLASLKTQFNQLRTDYNAHVHGGVTAGAANTAATTATTATAVTLQTDP